MEILIPVIVEAVKSTAKFFFSAIPHIVDFHDNIKSLQSEMTILSTKEKDVGDNIELAKLDGKSTNPQANEWLEKVKKTEIKVNKLLVEYFNDGPPVDGCVLKCNMLRCRRSRKAARKLDEVRQLINLCNFEFGWRNKRSPERRFERMPAPSISGQKASSKMLDQLLKFLNDDNINKIGVWGMGGVGKSTLVKTLNNELESSSLGESFDMAIWVEVPKDLDLRTIQSQVAERLKLELEERESTHIRANRLLKRLMTKKKILLILDDVWKKIDLDVVGIPQVDDHPCLKILLTTRSFDMCREMMTDADIKVDVLSEEDAWNLFAQSAGNVVELQGIETLAREIARECCGLPLAIKTMAMSMRAKTKMELWKGALFQLRSSIPSFESIENEVFLPLSVPYFSLQSKILQQCFLYCSLYPENFPIKICELIQCWVADGLINKDLSQEELFNNGIALVENLKDFCLLELGEESGTVKLHDVVRDVAIWLSRSEEEYGFFSQSDNLMHEFPKKFLKRFKRVSFMGKRITRLPARLSDCSELTALFLQGNPIKKIPDEFFREARALRILNLSGTHITSLPPSLLHVRELCVLLLRDTCNLEKLPPLESLYKLQVLDLSGSQLRELPKSIGKLHNLRELNLSHTHHLENIEAGILSRLSSLEALDMSCCAYMWEVKCQSEEQRATIDELLSLDRLLFLHLRLDKVNSLVSNSSWLRKLRKFDIQIGPRSCDSSYNPSPHDEKRVILRGVDLMEGGLDGLWCSTSALDLVTCGGLSGISKIVSRRSLCGLANLKSLTITNCDWVTNLISAEKFRHSFLPNLEHLTLNRLRNLRTILEGMVPNGGCLGRLRNIEVVDCPKLRHVISYALLWQVQNLEEIKVSGCKRISCIVKGRECIEAFQKLKAIELKDLMNFKSFCLNSDWPISQRIEVSNCPRLKTIPSSASSSVKITEI